MDNFGAAVERSDVVFRRAAAILADVQPSSAPPLDGVGEFDVKTLDIRADANNNTAYVVGNVVGAITAEVEDAHPQSPVGMDSKERFAQGDEDRDVEDGVGSKMVKLQSIHEQQPTKEVMDGSGKTTDEMVDKTYPVSHWRGWVAFFAGEANRFGFRGDSQFLQEIQVLVCDLGPLPLRSS